jgi:Flp pilus assembly protein TadG
LPFIVLLALALVQFGVVVANQLAVLDAAQCAARAAAISGNGSKFSQDVAQRDAEAAGNECVALRPLRVDLTTTVNVVTARVKYLDSTDLPVVGLLFPNLTLEAAASMQIETP